MGNYKIFLHDLITAEEESKWRKTLLGPLYLLSLLYGWIVSLRVHFYSRGILRTHSLPCRVVSVGNITLGGTGKTPFVALLAEILTHKGLRVAVLSRGYGGDLAGRTGVVSDGRQILMDPRQSGDEPYLLAQKLRDIPVIVGKDRYRSGQYALERFRAQVLLLDDGFQHLALRRDVNFLLLDSSSPFGNGNLFPRGVLREPKGHLARADAIILTKTGMSGNIHDLKGISRKWGYEGPLFRVDYEPLAVQVYGEAVSLGVEALKGKKVLAFSGLAKPESFLHTLGRVGVRICAMENFPDHHWYSARDWDRLLRKAEETGVEGLITTEKDLVRIRSLRPSPVPLWAVCVRHFFPGNDQPRFEEFLFSRLGFANE